MKQARLLCVCNTKLVCLCVNTVLKQTGSWSQVVARRVGTENLSPEELGMLCTLIQCEIINIHASTVAHAGYVISDATMTRLSTNH